MKVAVLLIIMPRSLTCSLSSMFESSYDLYVIANFISCYFPHLRRIEMVQACGKNGCVKDQSQWGTRETEVNMDGWCEGGLSKQRNDGGGCATMSERSERAESPGAYVTEWVLRGHFCLALCSFGPPSRALVVITWRGEGCRYIMRLA